MTKNLTAGDFTGLAQNYTKYRPNYSTSILGALLGQFNRPSGNLDVADVGAGTGIWTNMVAQSGVKSVTAVEPNDDMREAGQAFTSGSGIVKWKKGSAEQTTLADESCDWLTMASSFHWADFDTSTKEFHRLLRPEGRFTALWNPRLIEVNPLLVEIEAYLSELNPNIKRVSSGRSGITSTLSDQLWASPYFEDVCYMEGRHEIFMSKERYLGAWRSVNDLQVQLGEASFDRFLNYVEEKLSGMEGINATYLTRAWSARVKK